MTLKKFLIPPEQSRYAVTPGEETVYTALEGGKGRYRKDILNATSTVVCKWTFTAIQFEYFMAFYKGITESGANSFLIDLIIDEANVLTEHTVNFVPNKVKAPSKVNGQSFEVQATLEVEPVIYFDGYWESVVFFYEAFGEDEQAAVDLINQLEQLVNVDFQEQDIFTP